MTKGKIREYVNAPSIEELMFPFIGSSTGLGGIRQVPDDKLPNDDFRAFKVYMTENWDRFSLWDGGCMMYNVGLF